VASYDEVIPPGGKGKITLKIRTTGYSGSHTWGARISTNDPTLRMARVSVKARVKRPIYLSSHRVFLRALEGERASEEIEIRGQLPSELVLTPGRFDLEGKVEYSLRELEKGRRYKLRFTNIPGPPINTSGLLEIKTNYPERPVISIGVFLHIQKKDSKVGLDAVDNFYAERPIFHRL